MWRVEHCTYSNRTVTKKVKQLLLITRVSHEHYKKPKEDMRHTSVLFTGTINLPNSAFCISKTTKLSLLIYFLHYVHNYTLLHISKLKKIDSVLLEIFVPENFLSLVHTKLQIYLS